MIDRTLLQAGKNEKNTFWRLIALGLASACGAVGQAYLLTLLMQNCFLAGKPLAASKELIAGLVVLALLRAAVMRGQERAAHLFASRVQQTLRQKVISHMFHLGPVGLAPLPSGQVIHQVTAAIDGMEEYFSRFLPGLCLAGLIPVCLLALTVSLDFSSFVLMVLTAPLIPLFMILIGKQAGKLNEAQWEVLSRLNAHLLDVLQGLDTLKLFGRSKDQFTVIRRLSSEFRDKTLKVLRIAFLSAFVLELVATISTALIAVSVGLKLLYGHMKFEQAFFVLLLTPEFYLPLRQLGAYFHAAMAGTTAAHQVFDFLALTPPHTFSGREPLPFSRSVALKLDHATVKYGTTTVLHNISLSIASGQTVALVGPSGSGKTTLSRLFLGFLAPDSGAVYVNEKSLSELKSSDWLAHVAYVPQNPHIFYGTIEENICFGLNKSRNEVEAACRQAQIADFIADLPDGYATVIGEGGRVLSGGQAQRLAIARAFLKDAPCLILDEATASLDIQAAADLQQVLQKLMADRTVLFIAHRLSSVMTADQIVVLQAGRIVEQGQHDELVAQGGLYAHLFHAYRRSL
ncbi:MAG: thiol reductant ABC exporter subunit CydD [Sporomusaceae bacterium]|nr:thiol reductant ABC exporter subunit CydD [Sporomusaceae bacterium]